MNREIHVRIRESLWGRFPWATRPLINVVLVPASPIGVGPVKVSSPAGDLIVIQKIGKNMSIIEDFQNLIHETKFNEALPLIKEIIKRNDSISTSWFNYGICLNGLKQYDEAGDAFLKAYELNQDDGGALFRCCIAYATASNSDKLFQVFKKECDRDPEMIDNFLEEKTFNKFFQEPRFKKLENQYKK